MSVVCRDVVVEELTDLLELCEEGHRKFLAAMREMDDIMTRAVYRFQAQRCRKMADELQERLERRGIRAEFSPAPAPERGLSERAHQVRCLNWQAAAAQRYDLALRRKAVQEHEEDRMLLSQHRQWLVETVRHILPQAPSVHLAAA